MSFKGRNKNEKRTLALILSSLMALTTLTGCGSNGDGKDTDVEL